MRRVCNRWRLMWGLLTAWLVLIATGHVCADVKPMALFCDHAVLQQQMPIPVWGTADPGEEVTVTLLDQKVTTKADGNGSWMVKLQPLPDNTSQKASH